MSAARLIPLALFVIDVVMLGQVLLASAAEKKTLVFAAPTVALFHPGDSSPAAGIIADRLTTFDESIYFVLAAAEEPIASAAIVSSESKAKTVDVNVNEKSALKAVESPARAAGRSDIAPQPQSKSSVPIQNMQKEKALSEKPRSIMQMLEGHETELLAAAAIAVAFFSVGWVCGGHYYLRRDRRRRTQLRF
jgi:hypothetical protein